MKHILVLTLILFAADSHASHIVGGEMNYFYLGNNQYRITLTVYRDCLNGHQPFDDPISIGVFDGNGNLIANLQEHIDEIDPVPNAINSPCLNPPTSICYEVAKYFFVTTLPPGGGAYTIAYQRCCRNHSIINIYDVQNTGATYTAQVTDPSIATVNSNPIFNNWPPTFICRNAPFTFDHSATDPDGDSLVYELSCPYQGGNQIIGMANPPPPPPYDPVIFMTPYNYIDPFGGVTLKVNSTTGILTATPSQIGQYVYGITVKEFRHGILLGETRRDFQVNVVDCPTLTVASIFNTTISCSSREVTFANNSFHGLAYKWDFGDPTVTNDTSSLANPIYAYPDTGNYTATLIAYSPEMSSCDDTVHRIVHIDPPFQTKYYLANQHCSNVFSFYDQSFGVHGKANYWLWNFGDNDFSSDSTPVHQYANPGDYNVTLITSVDPTCPDSMSQVLHVLRNPVSDFTLSLDTCTYTISTKNNSQFQSSSRWDFGDYWNSFDHEGSHHYSSGGDYDVQLIVSTDSMCVDSFEIQISIPDLAVADFSFKVPPCDSLVSFTNLSRNAVRVAWEFGDGDSSKIDSPDHTYSISGNVPVKLIACSPYGCTTELDRTIYFVSKKESEFKAALDSCSGFVNFYDITNGAANYYWTFGDGTGSTDKIPKHNYGKDGSYYVLLSLNPETQCADSMGMMISNEEPLGEKVFIPNTFTPNGDGLNDLFHPSIFRPCEIYKLTILNRWGQVLLESDDASEVFWDGSFQGQPMPNDLYVYSLKGEEKTVNGYINIQR